MTFGSIYVNIDAIIKAVTLTFMLLGLVSLPILPGLLIVWIAALGYGVAVAMIHGWASGVGTLGVVMFVLLSILMVVGSFVDNVLMGTQAHKEGAPWWAVLVAMLAAIAGNFLLPILGGILAALLVLFLIEWLRLKDWKRALTSMRGMLIGCGWAFVIRFIMGMVMIGLWMIWAWA